MAWIETCRTSPNTIADLSSYVGDEHVNSLGACRYHDACPDPFSRLNECLALQLCLSRLVATPRDFETDT